MPNASPLDELVSRLRRGHTLGTIADLLQWDEQVNLPPGAAEQRAAQHAALAEVHHAAASDPRIGEQLGALEADAGKLTPDQSTVVAHARRDYDRATKLPAEFVREKAAQGSRGYHAWAKAKAADDFASYAPVLEKNLEFARREAAYLGHGAAPYDYALDKHDPGLTTTTVDRLFAELKRDLVPLVRAIAASPRAAEARAVAARLKGFPVEGQGAFLREVTAALGFDYARGRIDVSLHPFCSGTGSDVRMTTRFNADQPLDALFSSIHETGHGLYEQGLPATHLGTALGLHAGMAVHESQSRLWENQVARSRAFWRHFEPRWRALFPEQTAGVTSEELHLAVNAVEPTLIRVDADEVTYNLHIVLRFELEKKLFAGELAVRDLPAAWRTAARELIGLEPANDREGVLQDVHWSDGSFGYFPSYCLGNMIAAQLWARVRAMRPALEEEFARGDFTWLLGWLRENIHAQGRRHSATELVQRVTGEPLSPRHLVAHLRERYGALYLG
ncbi:MAG: carboxypeptidase M32 [Opitutaceae bacterium]|nr:carboxypeptidase M32 [Opitutaceae bacterium]